MQLNWPIPFCFMNSQCSLATYFIRQAFLLMNSMSFGDVCDLREHCVSSNDTWRILLNAANYKFMYAVRVVAVVEVAVGLEEKLCAPTDTARRQSTSQSCEVCRSQSGRPMRVGSDGCFLVLACVALIMRTGPGVDPSTNPRPERGSLHPFSLECPCSSAI